MFKYYLSEAAYSQVGIDSLQTSLMELNKAMVEHTSPCDEYYYSTAFWSVQIAPQLATDAVYLQFA